MKLKLKTNMYDSKACAFDHYILLPFSQINYSERGKKRLRDGLKTIIVFFPFAFLST